MPLRTNDAFQGIHPRMNLEINPYVAKLKQAQEDKSLPILLGEDLKNMRGNWLKEFFPTKKKLFIEIGSHYGITLKKLAQLNPDIGFIGIDITYKRLYKAAFRVKKAELDNVVCIMANAISLETLFAEAEIDGVIGFFPDPWQKKQNQSHNRLFKREFIAQLSKLSKGAGFFWLKTDCQSYFQDVEANESHGLLDPCAEFPLKEAEYSSVFEQLFKGQNKPIYGKQWQFAKKSM